MSGEANRKPSRNEADNPALDAAATAQKMAAVIKALKEASDQGGLRIVGTVVATQTAADARSHVSEGAPAA